MEELLRLIRSSYGAADREFAGHPNDRERAAQSIKAANDAEVGYEEFLQLHRDFLAGEGRTQAHINTELEKVKDITRYFTND